MNLEMSLGLIAVWSDEGDGHPDYVAQVKTLIPRLQGNNWGLGFVLGRGRDPGLSGVRKSGSQIYGYVPLTVSLHSSSPRHTAPLDNGRSIRLAFGHGLAREKFRLT